MKFDPASLDLVLSMLVDFSGPNKIDELGICAEDIHAIALYLSKARITSIFHFIQQQLPALIHLAEDQESGWCAYIPDEHIDQVEDFLCKGGFAALNGEPFRG